MGKSLKLLCFLVLVIGLVGGRLAFSSPNGSSTLFENSEAENHNLASHVINLDDSDTEEDHEHKTHSHEHRHSPEGPEHSHEHNHHAGPSTAHDYFPVVQNLCFLLVNFDGEVLSPSSYWPQLSDFLSSIFRPPIA